MRIFVVIAAGIGAACVAEMPSASLPSGAGAGGSSAKLVQAEPDPLGRVHRDEGFISAEVVAPATPVRAGNVTEFTVRFEPRSGKQAHWNNGASAMRLWVQPPPGFRVHGERLREHPQPRAETSDEARAFTFMLDTPATQRSATVTITGYALYFVCEDAVGTCMHRRLDFAFPLTLAP